MKERNKVANVFTNIAQNGIVKEVLLESVLVRKIHLKQNTGVGFTME